MRTEATRISLALVEDLVGVELAIFARHVHVVVDCFGVGIVDGVAVVIVFGLAIGLAADHMRRGDDLQRAAFGLALRGERPHRGEPLARDAQHRDQEVAGLHRECAAGRR